jgi:hypothetical protein
MAGLVAGTNGVKNALALTHWHGTSDEHCAARTRPHRCPPASTPTTGDIPAFWRGTPRSSPRCARAYASGRPRAHQSGGDTALSATDVNTTVAAPQDGLPGTSRRPEIAPILPDIVGEAAILCWLGDGGALSRLGIDPLASIRRAAATALAPARFWYAWHRTLRPPDAMSRSGVSMRSRKSRKQIPAP